MLRFFAFSKTSNARCEVARLKIHRESVTFSNWFLSCCWLLPVMGRSQFSFLHPLINLSFRKKYRKTRETPLFAGKPLILMQACMHLVQTPTPLT